MQTIATKSTSSIEIWILSLSAFCYPISVGAGILLHLPTQNFNIFYRIIILFLSIYLIINRFKNKTTIKFNKINILFVLFWIIYSIRLFYDLFIIKVPYAREMGSEFVILLFAFGTCFLPAFAILISNFNFDERKAFSIFYNTIIISNIITFLVLIKTHGLTMELFISRAMVLNEDEVATLNPITISYIGCFLIIFTISKWNINNIKKKFFEKIILISISILGFFNLFAGASRGPIFIFIILALIILYKYWIFAKKSKLYILKLFALFFCFSLTLSITILPKLKDVDLVFVSRLLFTLDRDKPKEERDFSIGSALSDFTTRPIFGNSFVGSMDGFYPHSILVESLMATGIIGSILFFPLIFYTTVNAFKAFSRSVYYIPIISIFIALFFSASTSGSIYFSGEFWIWLVFVNEKIT